MSNTVVNKIHPGDRRGHTKIDWLDSYHTFAEVLLFDLA
jgi:hypothetical protein